ncbi:arsenate reductase (glutaredoxin) [Tamlana sp. 62-3]|uniref:Arsenate reductase (Glutaredoxin) n=1 Tax=Neotamlana sargassicola TaxID=2883125 RepID=A0A9X1L4Y0_9FLAO|nr:arsenate reductase (glutaredoxin) [Tamlana sargassicola]MCB4808595.1 arsenate reductase (glutaredoxin) [Tamlana sargassicola]
MITIYHNNRCRKSREGLQILEDSGKEFKVVKYLEDTPSEEKLKEIIKLLGIKPLELVRKNEAIWKANFKGKELSDSEVISALAKFPKLIERPIVINGDKAVVGRPPEQITTII